MPIATANPRMMQAARSLDARVSLKSVHRRLELVAKTMIVLTFLEDALRCAITYGVQRQSMQIAGWENPLMQGALPLLSMLVQLLGGALVILPRQRHGRQLAGCAILVVFCTFHPIMYGQQRNWEFVSETATIQGGLLVLMSHVLLTSADNRKILPTATEDEREAKSLLELRASWLQAVGRVLITSVFVYYALRAALHCGQYLGSHESVPGGDDVWDAALVVALLGMCALVVVGMKSRWCAMVLALAMGATAVFVHPFFLPLVSGHLGVGRLYVMDGVSGMEGLEVDALTYADHQRYFFFQDLSTVGALLLLCVHGPGKISLDEQDGPPALPRAKGDQ